MPYRVPPAVNYPGPLVMVKDRYKANPVEGFNMVPADIDWGTMGGADHCVEINLQVNATLNFSQICALVVDNSDCACDIRFVFPDTGVTVTIPAYSPYDVYPVFTNNVQFYVQAGLNGQVVQSTDQTRMSIHNSVPPPISIPTTEAQQFASVASIDAATAATTTIIPAGTNGRLEDVDIFGTVAVQSNPYRTFVWKLKDNASTPNVFAQGTVAAFQANAQNISQIYNMNGLARTFVDGLYLEIVSTNLDAQGTLSVNVGYRSP